MTRNAPRPTRNTPRPQLRRTAAAALLLAALATACSQPAARHADPGTPTSAAQPGQLLVRTGDIDLSVTHATAHLDASGSGTLTLTLHNGGDAPEHLGMVATSGGARGTLSGDSGKGDGSLSSAGILVRPGGTVTIGGHGPQIRLTGVHAASATLPLALEFGIAGLVHLDAVVQKA
ncbi:hypothetical protein [Actinacidiphila acidipaludis]|uniref:Lipoprotein n=1 Tax=Actinacidiphila acidipaludis TaxID=2873382 RepID=A0ABS7QCF5_9ACTN|nr:hypothetical protein [Streptomyces acidipaludis]MBY8880852.1 hypothetical protein [Streptomyces acidipaludis]